MFVNESRSATAAWQSLINIQTDQCAVAAVVDDYRPGCVYLSKKKEDYSRKPMGLTLKLGDFSFPGEEIVNSAKSQFSRYLDTLCKTLARMQVWKQTTSNTCLLYDPHAKQKATEYQKRLNLTDANFSTSCTGMSVQPAMRTVSESP
jgi:hypothetical protein